MSLTVPNKLESKRLILRRFSIEDLDLFVRFMCDREATQFMAFPEAMKTLDGATNLFESTLEAYDADNPLFALAVQAREFKKIIGCCGLNLLNSEEAEIFYAVFPAYCGFGYGTEMAKALSQYALEKCSLKRIRAFIAPCHNASRRVAEKAGFKHHGLVDNSNFSEQVCDYILTK